MKFKFIKRKSPNFYSGRQGQKADIIVMHQTAGDSVNSAIAWFENSASETSSHFVIDKNGDQYQFVELDNSAWCNGTSLKSTSNIYYAKAKSNLVKSRATNANFFTYSIEFVHNGEGNITEAQINSVVDVILNKIVPHMKANGVAPIFDREHILGHCDINSATRALCPGVKFPYDRIISLLKKSQPENPVVNTNKVYKVQLGAFSTKETADNFVKDLKRKGLSAVVIEETK